MMIMTCGVVRGGGGGEVGGGPAGAGVVPEVGTVVFAGTIEVFPGEFVVDAG
jgi:hypothetical protein